MPSTQASHTPQHSANILVFDSGVGGLSIVQHLRQQLPHCAITYLADNDLFPYGLLHEDQLVERVNKLLSTVIEARQPDLVIIACNTASTLVLPSLRANTRIPIVGVVPAIKPAAQRSHSKVIGLLATPATIARDYTDELISEFAEDCEIIRVGSLPLVTLAEDYLAGNAQSAQAYSAVLAPFQDHPKWQQMDAMVLACTHFPLVLAQLSAAAPAINLWIDSGDAIARRAASLLEGTENRSPGHDCALFTARNKITPGLRTTLSEFGFEQVDSWPL